MNGVNFWQRWRWRGSQVVVVSKGSGCKGDKGLSVELLCVWLGVGCTKQSRLSGKKDFA